MVTNNLSNFPERDWENALKLIAHEGEVFFVSRLLRKYFRKRSFNQYSNIKCIQMADVYCQLVYMGYCNEKEGLLLSGGYFQTNSRSISEGLAISVRRVREMTNLLQAHGLIEIRKKKYVANGYRVIPEALIEIIKTVYPESPDGLTAV